MDVEESNLILHAQKTGKPAIVRPLKGFFMALSPQKFREIVFQLVYSQDFTESEEKEEMAALMMAQLGVTRKSMREAEEKKHKIQEKRSEIDLLIRKASQSYDLERIPRVERNILRLGIFELFHERAIPPKVVIAEAIRLCRKFATAEAAAFVNALLDSLYQSSQKEDFSSSQEFVLASEGKMR